MGTLWGHATEEGSQYTEATQPESTGAIETIWHLSFSIPCSGPKLNHSCATFPPVISTAPKLASS